MHNVVTAFWIVVYLKYNKYVSGDWPLYTHAMAITLDESASARAIPAGQLMIYPHFAYWHIWIISCVYSLKVQFYNIMHFACICIFCAF